MEQVLVGLRRAVVAGACLVLAACAGGEKSATRATRVRVQAFEGRYGAAAAEEFAIALRDAGHLVVEDAATRHDFVVSGTVRVEGASQGGLDVRVSEVVSGAIVHSESANEGVPAYEDTESAFIRPCARKLRDGVLAAVEGRGKPRALVVVLAFADRTVEGRGQIGLVAAEQMRDLLAQAGVPVLDGLKELGEPAEVARRLGAACALTGEVAEDGAVHVRLSGAHEGAWSAAGKAGAGGVSREEIAAGLRRALEGVAESISAAMR